MKSLNSYMLAAKNAWSDAIPWVWLIKVEYTGWYMIEYISKTVDFKDGATATSGGASGTIVVNVPVSDTWGFLIVKSASGTFTSGASLTDDGGGNATVYTSVDTSTADPVICRFINDTEHYVLADENWDVYYPFPFMIEQASFAKSQFRALNVVFSNALHYAESLVRRANGLKDATVSVRIAYRDDNSTDALDVGVYTVQKADIDDQRIVIACGMENFLLEPFPRRKFSRKRCSFRFKSDSCGYSGASTSCTRYLDNCLSLSNVDRGGFFPGIPGGFFST